MSHDTELTPSVLVTVDDVALACDIPIAPDAVNRIDGFLFVRDWPATSAAREGMGAVTITRHDDGAVAMELARYEVETRSHTDRRAIPIGESMYEALANALFEPKGEPAIPPRPVVTEAVVVSTVDGEHRNLNHQIREEIGNDGRVTLTVRGLGGGETRTVSMFEPAVAAYIDRRLAFMEETVARLDTADRTGIEVAEPTPLGAGRPACQGRGRISARLESAEWRMDCVGGLEIDISGGETRITVRGHETPAVVVASGEWAVERYVRRLLYTLGFVEGESRRAESAS